MSEQDTKQPKQSHRLRRIGLGLAGAALVLAIAVAYRVRAASRPQAVAGGGLQASGIIQAEEVSIASEFGGRILEITVAEGDVVAAGDRLVQLDTTLLDARIESVEAMVALAEAGLAQVRAGARPGQIAAAQAQLAQAEAGRVAARQAVSDLLALVENPQDINLQIAILEAQLESAQHQYARAETFKDGAAMGKEMFEEAQEQVAELGGAGRHRFLVASGSTSDLANQLPPEIVDQIPPEIEDYLLGLGDGVYAYGDWELHIHGDTYELYNWVNVGIPLELHLMPNTWWQAWVALNAAIAQREGLEASLAQLYAQRANPQSMQAKLDEARAMLAQAEAQIAAAQAQVDGLNSGATDEQVAALEARVAQAQAGLEALLEQKAMLEIASPIDGTVIDIVAHPGEVVAKGAALLTVADLSTVFLTVYVPENHIGRVYLDQEVTVTVDSFPGRVFEGRVSHISDRAEFTPRNVATQEERVNLVFAVDIRIANHDGALKPGMPADAVFGGR